jgi:tRNA A-37 threonylcarbamoyl transferase component Bud32
MLQDAIAYACLIVLFQRVFESSFVGRRSIVKERFSKKYRHPTLDSKLTIKRLNAVREVFLTIRSFFTGFRYKIC